MGSKINTLLQRDARSLQIIGLCSFLLIGVLWRDFSIQVIQVFFTFVSALLTQAVGIHWVKVKQKQHRSWGMGDFLSAFITSFGISILIRADHLWAHPLLACIAIMSKFVITYANPIDELPRRMHLFNPANLAAILALYAIPGAWLSPGQWGQEIGLAGLFFCFGSWVAWRAKRLDVAWVFLGSFALLQYGRVIWIEGRIETVWHQLSNGSLLLFTFFMITDPMTTPQHPWIRRGFAIGVALIAFVWQYTQFRPNGAVIGLFMVIWLVPWMNRWWSAPRFKW